MENKTSNKSFLPIMLIFLVVGAFALTARDWLGSMKMDFRVLLVANTILFAATWISYALYSKALHHKNMQVFLRMVYGSFLLKMMLCIAATLVYVYVSGPGVNKQSILASFGLYTVYTFAEVRALLRSIKKMPKNA